MAWNPLELLVSLIGQFSRLRRKSFCDTAVGQNPMNDISTAQETQHKTHPTTR